MKRIAPSRRRAPVRLTRLIFLAAAGCYIATTARAASLHVDPITFSLSVKDTSAVLHISNADEQSVRVQVSAISWTVSDEGAQVETPTDEILLNPPVFQIEAHQTQFIRFGVRHPRPGDVEHSYRLIIEEVPDPTEAPVSGLRTVLRISVPVFVKPAQPKLHLSWSVQQSGPASILSVVNDGNTHQRLLHVVLAGRTEHPTQLTDVPIYLLPSERRTWRLTADDAEAGPKTLELQTDHGPQEEVVGTVADRP